MNEAASAHFVPEPAPPPAAVIPQTAPLPGSVKINLPREFSRARARVPAFIYEVQTYMQMRQIEGSIMTLMPALLAGTAAAWWQSLLAEGAAPVT
jgi:hypothetical protein